MKLYMSLALLLLAGNADADTNSTSTEEACNDESGYEVWRSLPPEDAKVKFEGRVDCDAETYTLTYSFEPDMNLPFINNITKVDWNGTIANPEQAAICAAEGLGFRSENVPEGTHVGQNVHYTDYSYSYETTKRIQEATGFKLLTIGAGPCGTPTQMYPHYSIHFYTIGLEDRKKMLCRSNGGYFCRPAKEQCSEAGLKFNLDGQGIERCEDNVTYANVPPGFRWTIDGNAAIGINAGSPGMGLHGLIPGDFRPGEYETPLLLMVQYDSTIVANHIVIWGGLPLGQNEPGGDFHWSKGTEYNCHDTEKYPTLPFNTTVHYVATEGRTYISISGPTDKCVKSFTEMWDSTATRSSKSGKTTKSSKTENFGNIF